MTDTTFQDQSVPPVNAAWLNTINRFVYDFNSVKLDSFGAGPGKSAAVNTAAFNAALAASEVVYVPGGPGIVYDLNALSPITGNVMIYGNATLRFNTTGDCITLSQGSSNQNIRALISGLKFTNTGNTPSSYINNNGYLNVELEQLTFSNCAATYCINNTKGYGLTVRKCVFSDVTGSAIQLMDNAASPNYSYVASIEHCDITRMSVDGIVAQGALGLEVTGGTIESCQRGIALSTNAQESRNVCIKNVHFESNTSPINCTTDGSTYASYITIISCTFSTGSLITLGSLGNLMMIGCKTPAPNACSITATANARVTLLDSPGWDQFNAGINFLDLSGIGKRDWSETVGSTVTTTLPINVNAGYAGRTLLMVISRQTNNGNNTGSAIYMVRLGYDGNNIGTPVQIAKDEGPLGAGSMNFTFGTTGGFLTITGGAGPSTGGNYSVQWFPSGSNASI